MASAILSTVNPSNGDVNAQYPIMNASGVGDLVKQSRAAFAEWKGTDIHRRAEFMHQFAQELRRNKTNLAMTATKEMGKPMKESLSEVEKCVWVMEFYGDEAVNTDARKSIVTFQPIGVIGSIMPWNFPYWQALRFAAPSLITGNTIVLKPASATV
jgi:succinate-semialdehyde dehydrogenase/glutarate-semialdehyde dehydrogenase/succinyl-CoA reductase